MILRWQVLLNGWLILQLHEPFSLTLSIGWCLLLGWLERWVVGVHGRCISALEVNLELWEIGLFGLGRQGELWCVSVLRDRDIHGGWVPWHVILTWAYLVDVVGDVPLWLGWAGARVEGRRGVCVLVLLASGVEPIFFFMDRLWSLSVVRGANVSGDVGLRIGWPLVHVVLCPLTSTHALV